MGEFTKTVIVDPDNPDPDYRTINQGINALNGNGGTIIAEQGTYAINSASDTINVPSDVTIIGHDNAMIEVTGNVAAFKNADQVSGNERITISGFKIVVDYAPVGVEPDEYRSNVIHFKKVKNCIIEKIFIMSAVDNVYGIFPGDPETALENLYPAIAIKLEGDNSASDCTDNIIRNCTISGFGNSIGEGIINNKYGIGIMLNRGKRNKIINNFVSDSKYGCLVEQGPYNTISFNVFRNMVETTITSLAPSINNGGLLVRKRESNDTNNTTIVGNIIDNCVGHGISIIGVKGCTVQGNICTHNGYYTQYVTTPGDQRRNGICIAFNHADNNTITGNIVSENASSGIQLTGDEYGTANHNTLSGNSCFNNTLFGIIISGTYNPDKNLFLGNICHGNNPSHGGCDHTAEFDYQICMSNNSYNADNVLVHNMTS